jgi:hypothetical protein
VTAIEHTDTLLELAVEAAHGAGRQGIVERLARNTNDERIVPTLKMLIDDQDVALQAMAGLRRSLGPEEALEHIRPLTIHPSERIRRAAVQQTRRAQKTIETRAEQAPPS